MIQMTGQLYAVVTVTLWKKGLLYAHWKGGSVDLLRHCKCGGGEKCYNITAHMKWNMKTLKHFKFYETKS